MVFVLFYYMYYLVDKGFFLIFLFGQYYVVMIFQIGFVYYVKFIVVKQSIYFWIIWIMIGMNGVQVEMFKEKNIFYYVFYRYCFIEMGMNIVMIGIFE